MQVFTSPDDLIQYAIEAMDKEFEIEDFTLSDDFNFSIKIKGETWDGLIDYRVAKYVEKLQNDIIKIYNNTFDENISLRNNFDDVKKLFVKVRVDEGCTELLVKFKDIILNMVSKMSGPQTVLLLAIVAALTTGTIGYSNYNKRLTEIAKVAENEHTKREAMDLAGKALLVAEKSSEGLKYALGMARDEDTIEFSSGGRTFQKGQMEELVPKARQSEGQSYRVDDNYKVVSINIEKQTATIRLGKKSFPASTKLMSEQDKIQLHEKAAEADLGDFVPELDLQVSIVVKEGQIDEAYMLGFGLKSEHAVALTDVVKVKPLRPETEQASLLGPGD